jgi:EF-hand domain pair
MFNMIDVSQDGFVDIVELVRFFYDTGDVDSVKHANAMLAKADVDHSGSIDFNEFCRYMVLLRNENKDQFHDIIESVGRSRWSFCSLAWIMPDMLFCVLYISWLNFLHRSLATQSNQITFTAKNILMSPSLVGSRAEREEWNRRQTERLPNYYMSCVIIYDEIYNEICGAYEERMGSPNEFPFVKKIISGFSIFLAFTGTFHLLTPKGRLLWSIVLKKYFIFVHTCFGVWTDDAVDFYELESLSKLISKGGNNDMDKDHVEMLALISLTIEPRAAIFLILPYGSFLSVFTFICSSTPIWLSSEKAAGYFSPLFIDDANEIAREKEMESGQHTLRAEERGVMWVVWIKSWGAYISYSRLFKTVQNLFTYAMTIGILFSDPYAWFIMSFIVYIPQISAYASEVFVLTGHFFDITDDDFVQFLPREKGYKASS